jgi:hypothetical protein
MTLIAGATMIVKQTGSGRRQTVADGQYDTHPTVSPAQSNHVRGTSNGSTIRESTVEGKTFQRTSSCPVFIAPSAASNIAANRYPPAQ